MTRTRALLALLLVLAVAGCREAPAVPAQPSAPTSAAGPAASGVHHLVVDGRDRTYRLHVPSGLDDPAPLVLVLHGGFGSGEQAERSYGWGALADREGVVVAYPDGLQRAWSVGDGCCGAPGREGVDDVAFAEAVVRDVSASTRVDAHRVYATGISNGGMLAHRIGCDSTVFAAIGPDSATLLGSCPHAAPLSVISVHGLADENVRYDGAPGTGVARIDGPPVPDVDVHWRAVDRCAPPTSTTDGDVTTSVARCPDGRAVELVTVAGAGHQWPGSTAAPRPGADPPYPGLDATAVIWAFFAAHPKR
ncbi:PHB depolymerase family esterase [Angustibacter peucedani]